MKTLYVRDVMTSPVLAITPHTRLPTIKHLMRTHQIHRLPVVGNNGVVSMVTLGDVRNAFPSNIAVLADDVSARTIDHVTAAAMMSDDVISVGPDTLLADAIQLLLQHQISGLPVVDNGILIGIVTKSDICRAMLSQQIGVMPQQAVQSAGKHLVARAFGTR